MRQKTDKKVTLNVRLFEQNSVLDPVRALERLIKKEHPEKIGKDILFSVKDDGERQVLSKLRFLKMMEGVWGGGGVKEGGWSGHSFRVGGASLRFNMGWDKEKIMEEGRWKSCAVDVYLKKYTEEEKEETKQFMWVIDKRNKGK